MMNFPVLDDLLPFLHLVATTMIRMMVMRMMMMWMILRMVSLRVKMMMSM